MVKQLWMVSSVDRDGLGENGHHEVRAETVDVESGALVFRTGGEIVQAWGPSEWAHIRTLGVA